MLRQCVPPSCDRTSRGSGCVLSLHAPHRIARDPGPARPGWKSLVVLGKWSNKAARSPCPPSCGADAVRHRIVRAAGIGRTRTPGRLAPATLRSLLRQPPVSRRSSPCAPFPVHVPRPSPSVRPVTAARASTETGWVASQRHPRRPLDAQNQEQSSPRSVGPPGQPCRCTQGLVLPPAYSLPSHQPCESRRPAGASPLPSSIITISLRTGAPSFRGGRPVLK